MARRPLLPEAYDPETFRDLGHRLVDQLAEYLRATHASEPGSSLPWRAPEDQLADTRPPGEEPTGDLLGVAGELLEAARHTTDPRCLGHQDSVPLPAAALAEFVVALINNDPSVYETAPRHVAIEQRVLRWKASEMGYGKGSGGVLTSGGSLGNLTALLAARQANAGYDAWSDGNDAARQLCVLSSEEIHYCVSRAVQIMGWGQGGVEKVPVDEQYRMRVDALPAALEAARASGKTVVAVAASAGTTATGAYDPLGEIADFCEREGLWLHVDGAHGGSAVLSPTYRHLVDGIERSDSIVWDAHKMMMMPPPLTSVLFRREADSYASFRQEATYLLEGRPDEEWYNAANRTIECTRNAMGTRLYVALRVHGAQVFRDHVTRAFDLARALAARVEEAPDFELAVAPQGNIVCYRHVPEGVDDVDAFQSAIRALLFEHGEHYIAEATLGDRQWLRSTVMHPLAEEAGLDALLDEIRGIGRRILA